MSQFIGNGYKHLCNSINKYHEPKLHLGVVCLKKKMTPFRDLSFKNRTAQKF